MSEFDPLPRAARPFLTFVSLLRANGFAIAPEQTTAFLSAISLLGPRHPEDIRRAGLAMLAGQKMAGKVKEAAGKMTGDAKLKAEGKADQLAGGAKNAIGGMKDSLRDADRKAKH